MKSWSSTRRNSTIRCSTALPLRPRSRWGRFRGCAIPGSAAPICATASMRMGWPARCMSRASWAARSPGKARGPSRWRPGCGRCSPRWRQRNDGTDPGRRRSRKSDMMAYAFRLRAPVPNLRPATAGLVLMDQLAEFDVLLRRVAVARDRAAFQVLFEHFAPRVKAYAMRLGASAQTAEDLAQEAMLIMWRKAGLFDPDRA